VYIANRENGTMIDIACEPNEDLPVAIVPDGQPGIIDHEDEFEVCDYCDLRPCGCGG